MSSDMVCMFLYFMCTYTVYRVHPHTTPYTGVNLASPYECGYSIALVLTLTSCLKHRATSNEAPYQRQKGPTHTHVAREAPADCRGA
jgi:hypothetical protein